MYQKCILNCYLDYIWIFLCFFIRGVPILRLCNFDTRDICLYIYRYIYIDVYIYLSGFQLICFSWTLFFGLLNTFRLICALCFSWLATFCFLQTFLFQFTFCMIQNNFPSIFTWALQTVFLLFLFFLVFSCFDFLCFHIINCWFIWFRAAAAAASWPIQLASWKRLELRCRGRNIKRPTIPDRSTDRAQRNPFEQTTRRVRLNASRRSIHLNRLKGLSRLFCFLFCCFFSCIS